MSEVTRKTKATVYHLGPGRPGAVKWSLRAYKQWSMAGGITLVAGRSQLLGGMVQLKKTPREPLGQLLIASGLINDEQLKSALELSRRSGRMLGQSLIEMGLMTGVTLARVVSSQLGIPYTDLADMNPEPDVIALVPESLARRHSVMPLEKTGSRHLRVAMTDPLNVVAIDDLRMATGLEAQPVMAAEEHIVEVINGCYRLDEVVENTLREVTPDSGPDLSGMDTSAEPDAPIVRLVTAVLLQAVREGASDVHLDPGERDVRVRYRVDGILKDYMRLPRRVLGPVISRIKVAAGMDIGERRLPQDGRYSLILENREVDLRVATMPTVHGEKATIRILDKSAILFNIESLGLLDHDLVRYRDMTRQPYGMVLVCGPTGSGKTTTLYATLMDTNDDSLHIITMEDPVEYHLKGINQIAVNRKAGLLFAAGLRSIVRLDPDTILVGEIRDGETAEIAVQSALTGHLVLSTLHTNDAAGAMTRLVEMGVEPFLVASAVNGIMAQRLVRRVCSHCAERRAVSSGPIEVLLNQHFSPEELKKATFVKAVGCSRCSNSGYRGRLAISEVLTVSEAVRGAVLGRKSASEIEAIARSEGMTTMQRSGFARAMEGLTTLEEVVRVVRV